MNKVEAGLILENVTRNDVSDEVLHYKMKKILKKLLHAILEFVQPLIFSGQSFNSGGP